MHHVPPQSCVDRIKYKHSTANGNETMSNSAPAFVAHRFAIPRKQNVAFSSKQLGVPFYPFLTFPLFTLAGLGSSLLSLLSFSIFPHRSLSFPGQVDSRLSGQGWKSRGPGAYISQVDIEWMKGASVWVFGCDIAGLFQVNPMRTWCEPHMEIREACFRLIVCLADIFGCFTLVSFGSSLFFGFGGSFSTWQPFSSPYPCGPLSRFLGLKIHCTVGYSNWYFLVKSPVPSWLFNLGHLLTHSLACLFFCFCC